MSVESISVFSPVRSGGNLNLSASAPENHYGLLDFARGLDAERRRLDQIALQAALETLNAQEAGE